MVLENFGGKSCHAVIICSNVALTRQYTMAAIIYEHGTKPELWFLQFLEVVCIYVRHWL
jgi:hypothetical protein